MHRHMTGTEVLQHACTKIITQPEPEAEAEVHEYPSLDTYITSCFNKAEKAGINDKAISTAKLFLREMQADGSIGDYNEESVIILSLHGELLCGWVDTYGAWDVIFTNSGDDIDFIDITCQYDDVKNASAIIPYAENVEETVLHLQTSYFIICDEIRDS